MIFVLSATVLFYLNYKYKFTNIYVARTILKLLGQDESLITYVQDRPGHDRRYAIESSKLETELGWRAGTAFSDGLRETIEWYRGNSAWIEHVRSGAYLSYYDRMYRQRQQTLLQR